MNGSALFGDQWQEMGRPAEHRAGPGQNHGGVMTGGMTAFLAAVGGTSLICYLMVGRRRNRSGRRSQGDNAGGGANGDSDGDGGNLFSWFSSEPSSSNSSGDWDSSDSGGDSGGGGDGGGGGD